MGTLWCNFFQLKYMIGLIQKKINLDNHSHDGPIRYFLEFDLDYLNKFHDLHNDYPLACEKIK